MSAEPRSADKVRKLAEVLRDRKRLLIYVQSPPDPDALASAAALLLMAEVLAKVKGHIVYAGVLGRAENRAMVRYLKLKLARPADVETAPEDALALVDTQPGTGNNPLPRDMQPHIVIDHHPIRDATRKCAFTDVRSNYGATSSILAEYLQALQIQPDAKLATALLYGIRSDTDDLGREASRPDIDSSMFLYPLADKRLLSRIDRERVPLAYFHTLAEALRKAVVYGPVVISHLRNLDNPDAAGEMADLLMRLENVTASFCYGVYGRTILLSLRCCADEVHAGEVMRKIVAGIGTGGGHGMMAGGQVPIPDSDGAERTRRTRLVRARCCRLLKADPKKKMKLVSPDAARPEGRKTEPVEGKAQ